MRTTRRKKGSAGRISTRCHSITVMLGFSLLFLRYWSLEAPGAWTIASLCAAIVLFIGIILQIVSLWRALQLEDDDTSVYRATLRWFLASVTLVLLSVVIAIVAFSGVLSSTFIGLPLTEPDHRLRDPL